MRRAVRIVSLDDIRAAKAKVEAIKRNSEIPPARAVEELTSCIAVLRRTRERYALAQAFHIRGMAYACGMEDHPRAFRDWRRALGIIVKAPEKTRRLLRLAGHIHFQMALHSEGAVRMRRYNQALRICRAAGWQRGEALVIVHRGLAWKEMGNRRNALRDLEAGLSIAREKKMGALRQLKGFIIEARGLPAEPT